MAIWMENLWILGQKQKTEKIISDTLFQFSVLFRFFVKIWVFFGFALNLDRIFLFRTWFAFFGPKLRDYVTIFFKNLHFYHFLSRSHDFLPFLGFLPFIDMFCIFWNKIQLLLVLRFSITIWIFIEILHPNSHFLNYFPSNPTTPPLYLPLVADKNIFYMLKNFHLPFSKMAIQMFWVSWETWASLLLGQAQYIVAKYHTT